MSLISVIVPVYNCEKYLQRCLNSIVNQDYKNLEIIIVNDGSSDNSLAICQNFAKLDKRIKVIDKTNGGVSSARNIALKQSNGDFIAFVDADDYIDLNTYSTLLNKQQETNADMVFCRIKRITADGNEVYPEEINLHKILKKDIAPFFYTTILPNKITKIEGVIWRTLYKKELIQNEVFNENLKYGEDLLFIASLILKSNNIAIVDDYLYNYYTNVSSACNLINEKYFKNLDNYYTETINFLTEHNLLDIKFLVDYGYLVRLIYNKIYLDDFSKQMKQLTKTSCILQSCLSKDSYKKIQCHETKKSVKIRNFLIYHKKWRILKLLKAIKKINTYKTLY